MRELFEPVAVIIRKVSDFGKFLVSFVNQRPVDFAYWNVVVVAAAARRYLHCGSVVCRSD